MPTLHDGEEIRFQGAGVLEKTAGVLTVSTERLLFSHWSGVKRRHEHLDVDIPLEALFSVELERRVHKQWLLLVAQGHGYTGRPRLEIEVSRPPDLVQLVNQLVAERRRLAQDAREGAAGKLPSIHVTVHPTPATPQVMLRCPYCRTVYPELAAKCPSCGAPF